MADDSERGVQHRNAGTPQTRGVAYRPKQPTRCHQHELVLPKTYVAFEAKIEKWISTCVLSRTEVNGAPAQRERDLVRGNPTLASLWESLKHLKGEKVIIKAHYVWGEARAEAIRFSVVVTLKVIQSTPSPTPRVPDQVTPRPPMGPEPDEDKDEDDDKKKPPPKKRILVNPPPPRPKGNIDLNELIEYAKKVLDFLKSSDADPGLTTRLEGAVFSAEVALGALSAVVVLLVWDSVGKKLVSIKDPGDLHHLTVQALSRLARVGKIEEAEHALAHLEKVLREAEKANLHPPSPPPSAPNVPALFRVVTPGALTHYDKMFGRVEDYESLVA